MIEIKLSQGAKPGPVGFCPRQSYPRDCPDAGVMEEDCISPARTAPSTPTEMMQFIAWLRHLPKVSRLVSSCVLVSPWEFMALVKAMLETGILPDYIVVDGAEGGRAQRPWSSSIT